MRLLLAGTACAAMLASGFALGRSAPTTTSPVPNEHAAHDMTTSMPPTT